jgi:hypothetical protein
MAIVTHLRGLTLILLITNSGPPDIDLPLYVRWGMCHNYELYMADNFHPVIFLGRKYLVFFQKH